MRKFTWQSMTARERHVVGISRYLSFYNESRPHQALDYRTPKSVYEDSPLGTGNSA